VLKELSLEKNSWTNPPIVTSLKEKCLKTVRFWGFLIMDTLGVQKCAGDRSLVGCGNSNQRGAR